MADVAELICGYCGAELEPSDAPHIGRLIARYCSAEHQERDLDKWANPNCGNCGGKGRVRPFKHPDYTRGVRCPNCDIDHWKLLQRRSA